MSRQVGSAHVEFSARTGKVVTGMEEAKRATRAAAREMKADIQEAKASIALMGEEVGVKLPRHLRSFLAELPGVSSAMATAFNGAAIVGLGMIAVEQAKKIYEAFHELEEIPAQLSEGFETLKQTIAASNDQLILQNVQLQNAINKFKGAPENKLQQQLAEATVEAVKLGQALTKDLDEYDKIFEKNKVGVWARFLGTAGIGDIQEQVTSFRTQFEKETNASNERIRKARAAGNKKLLDDTIAEEKAAAEKRINDELGVVKRELETREQWQKEYEARPTRLKHPLQDAPIAALRGVVEALNEDLEKTTSGFENLSLAEEKAGQTGLSAAELQKKAAEEAAKALREQLKLEAERLKFRDEMVKKFQQGEESDRAELQRSADLGAKLAEQIEKDAAQAQKTKAEIIAATQKTRRTEAEEFFASQSQMEAAAVETGQETNAQRIANLRVAAAEQLRITQDALDQEAAAYSGNAEKQEAIDQERLKAVAEYTKETAALNREAMDAGIGGAMTEMVRRAMDTATQMREIFTSMVSGINDQLANMMTGKRVTSRDWSNMFSGIAGQATRSALSTAEGYALKSLGIVGKADGSQGKPFWVKNADNIKKAGADIASLAKGSPDPSTSPMGGFSGWIANQLGGGGIFGSILSALVPHASGGPMIPGAAYLVGERGPEPFFPGVSGSMGTNAAMRRAFGGGGATFHMPIDARGSTDPAATVAAVNRALYRFLPTMVTASAAFQHDMKRRTQSPAVAVCKGGSFC